MKLHIAGADWTRAEAAVAGLTRVARCLGRQPYLLTDAISQVGSNLRNSKGYWLPETLLAVVDALNDGEGYEAASLGLAVLQAAGEALGWNAESASRLKACRVHPNAAVRSLALDIWTAAE
ncbi:hypothetical protein D3C76_1601370 [compost metagenome]